MGLYRLKVNRKNTCVLKLVYNVTSPSVSLIFGF